MAGVHCLGHMGNNCIFYVSRLPECNLKFIDIHKAQDKPSTLHANLLSSWLAICCKYVAALLGRTGNNMCTVYTVQPTFGGFPPGWHDVACFRFMAFLYHLHFTYNFWSVVICSIVISVGAHSPICALSTNAPGGAEWYTYMYIMEIKTCWLKIENPVVLLRNRNPLNPNSTACSGINCIKRIPIAPWAISKWLARPRRSVGLT